MKKEKKAQRGKDRAKRVAAFVAGSAVAKRMKEKRMKEKKHRRKRDTVRKAVKGAGYLAGSLILLSAAKHLVPEVVERTVDEINRQAEASAEEPAAVADDFVAEESVEAEEDEEA